MVADSNAIAELDGDRLHQAHSPSHSVSHPVEPLTEQAEVATRLTAAERRAFAGEVEGGPDPQPFWRAADCLHRVHGEEKAGAGQATLVGDRPLHQPHEFAG